MISFRYLVHDVDAAVGFYKESLGFELVEQYGPAMAILKKGALTLWVAGPASSAAKPMPNGDKPAPGGSQILIEDPSGNVVELFEPKK